MVGDMNVVNTWGANMPYYYLEDGTLKRRGNEDNINSDTNRWVNNIGKHSQGLILNIFVPSGGGRSRRAIDDQAGGLRGHVPSDPAGGSDTAG